MVKRNFVVAIPSYRRAHVLSKKRLSIVRHQGILPECVHVFVASEEERLTYRAALDRHWKHIIVGELGLWKQRNFITRYFEPGTHILQMDDDLESLQMLNAQGLLDEMPPGFLLDIIESAYLKMTQTGAHLWSLNVSDNPLYMKEATKKLTFKNGLCNGFFFGVINRHDEDLLLEFGDGHEDVERSCKHYEKDGRVLRFQEFCVKTRCKANAGGLQASLGTAERSAEEDRSVALLMKRFPSLLCREGEGKLGLKFARSFNHVCDRLPMPLTCQDFSFAVSQSKVALLEGARWVTPTLKFATGVILAFSATAVLLEADRPKTQRLAMEIRTFYEQLRDSRIMVVWVPDRGCTGLKLLQPDIPKELLWIASPPQRNAPSASRQRSMRKPGASRPLSTAKRSVHRERAPRKMCRVRRT